MLPFSPGLGWPGTAGCSFQRKGTDMHYSPVTKNLFSAAVGVLLATTPAKAIIYKEAVSGDLSDGKAAPTPLTLTPGVNSISGTVAGFPDFGGTDPQDWVSFTIPAGFVMTSYINAVYNSVDPQGFTGFAFGSSFPAGMDSEFVAANYTGYAHFGTAAQNPDMNPTTATTVGVNLLPLMADPSFAPGTTNPTFPLAAGTYTFLIQQGDPNITGYRFDINVRSVPEPGSSLCLLGLGALATLALRRRLS
jgi:hypothetical protein